MGKTFIATVILCLGVQPMMEAEETGSSANAGAAQPSGAGAVRVVVPMSKPAPLRAVPLPADSLARPVIGAPAVRSTHSMQYGPTMTRPSGSVVVPFGSSGYYYRR